MNGTTLIRFFTVCMALATAPASWAEQPRYDALYIFGDSLSDNGNDLIATRASGIMPAIPPSETPNATYFQGRFSNGPVAVEYLWRLLERNQNAVVLPSLAVPELNKGAAVNFAFGGSGSGTTNATSGGFMVPGALGQVGLFNAALANWKPRHHALYVVWTGSNDYILSLTSDPQVVVGNIAQAVQSLYGLGARDFLIPNLPDMGLSPLVQSRGVGPQFTQLTQAHNALLAQTLAGLARSLPKAKIASVDVYGLGQTLVASGAVTVSPPALAYVAPTTPGAFCLFTNPATCTDVSFMQPIPTFLFWDVLHPTTQVHSVIGAAMFTALAKVKKGDSEDKDHQND